MPNAVNDTYAPNCGENDYTQLFPWSAFRAVLP